MMSDEDYVAIEEAVLSTARGRWFLTEYARRIRAAETDRIVTALGALAAGLETGALRTRQTGPRTPTDAFAIALADIDALPLVERLKLTG